MDADNTNTRSCNPIVHLKHAWNATSTIWGKSCIILFYSFIWYNVIFGIVAIFNPTIGTECYFQTMSQYSAYMSSSFMRQINLFCVAFLLMADRGGIRIWNVGMVFVVYSIFTSMTLHLVEDYKAGLDGAPAADECPPIEGFAIMAWISQGWISLALLCSIMEQTLSIGSSGNSGETTPLVS